MQIKTIDVAKYVLNDTNYNVAKFNINKNGENNIISSLGEYIIIWKYNDIRREKITNYKIKKVNDLVIDNYFKVDNGNKIIIGMPNTTFYLSITSCNNIMFMFTKYIN